MFQAYDWNGDKKVAAAEIKASWKGWYDVDWSEEDILLAFDRDSDGELDLEEFHQYDKDGDSLYYYKKMDADSGWFFKHSSFVSHHVSAK